MIVNMTSNSVDVGEDPDGQLYLVTAGQEKLPIPDPESLISILSGKIQHAARHSHEVEIVRTDDTVKRRFFHTHKFGDKDHTHSEYNMP